MRNRLLFRGAQPDYTNYTNITKVTFVISERPMAKWLPNLAKILKRAKGEKCPKMLQCTEEPTIPHLPLPPPYWYEDENTYRNDQVRKAHPNGLRCQMYLLVVWRRNSIELIQKDHFTSICRHKTDTAELSCAFEGRSGHSPFFCVHITMWLDFALYFILSYPQKRSDLLTSDFEKRNHTPVGWPFWGDIFTRSPQYKSSEPSSMSPFWSVLMQRWYILGPCGHLKRFWYKQALPLQVKGLQFWGTSST